METTTVVVRACLICPGVPAAPADDLCAACRALLGAGAAFILLAILRRLERGPGPLD